MSLFSKKTKGHLGIDFGAGGIKVVQLREINGRGSLFTYGFSEFAPEETGLDYLENPERAGALLKQICAKAKVTTTSACAALPIPAVFSAVLSLAPMPKKDLPQAVQWEAKKLIPLPIEEVTLDFKELAPVKEEKQATVSGVAGAANGEKVASAKKPEQKTIEVLLTAASKAIIEKYVKIAKVAGLTLASLETEAFALIRSLQGSDPSAVVIVDMGAVRSNILIVDRGIPMFTRSVEIGGKKCTEAIAASLGVPLAQAEAMKRDIGGAGFPGIAPGALPPIFAEVLEPLINEIKYSFSIYKNRNGSETRLPEKIVLSGGGAGLPGLAEFLAGQFNIRTFLGNPWEHVNFQPDLQPVLHSFGSKFSVAIGLAMRNL